jgi:hypothetical protein
MNSGWVDTVGCPSEVFDGLSAGLGANGTFTRTTPTTASGPTSVPALTSKFVPSCAFTFSGNNGITGSGEIFIGMGQAYDTLFASGLVHAGFVVAQTSGNTVIYLRTDSVVALTFIPPGINADPYSAVGVIGTTVTAGAPST